MNHSPLLFTLCLLTACSASPPDNIEQINHLQVPLVMVSENTLSVQTSYLASLYQQNKLEIDILTTSLKEKYLQNTTEKDIFTADSPVQPVFSSLTKLEQLALVNRQYLKDKK